MDNRPPCSMLPVVPASPGNAKQTIQWRTPSGHPRFCMLHEIKCCIPVKNVELCLFVDRFPVQRWVFLASSITIAHPPTAYYLKLLGQNHIKALNTESLIARSTALRVHTFSALTSSH